MSKFWDWLTKKQPATKHAPAALGPGPWLQGRAYHAAKNSRLTAGWASTANTSSDAELVLGLRILRARSRALIRDSGYAKRAKGIVVTNVIGRGIGMQATVANSRGAMNKRINDEIETAWEEWCRAVTCHTGGRLHFSEIEQLAIGQTFDTGEVFLRLHRRSFNDSPIPLAIEVIEAERIADEYDQIPSTANLIRMGVEVDEFYRPLAYWIRPRHPGDLRPGVFEREGLERVPADQIIHLARVDRWPQTRGEPWMHTAMRRLNDMDGYSEAEIIAARAAACYMGFIKSPDENPLPSETTDGQRQVEMEAGIIEHLQPGEDFVGWSPSRPNPNMDPFLRLLLREVAAGTGVSYESLSRDYSQSNYSSSRLGLLDDRDLWRVLQSWFIRSFREPLHRIWMEQATLAGAFSTVSSSAYVIAPRKFDAAAFKPRGWTWVDPTKEVGAYKEAERAGYITKSDIIAATAGGQDIEDVLRARRRELDLIAELGLAFDTDAPAAKSETTVPESVPQDEDEPPVSANGRVIAMR